MLNILDVFLGFLFNNIIMVNVQKFLSCFLIISF